MMSKSNRARLLMILSMFVFGTIAPFVRQIPVASGELALYRAVMAAVLLGAFLLITRQKIPFATIKRALPLLLCSGIAMGLNWVLLFEAYKHTTVSVATLSYYFAPVIVTVVSPVFFRERLTRRQVICFAMSTLGLVLITGTGDLSQGSSHLTGVLYGLGAAALYAAVILLNKLIKDVAGIHRTFLQFIAAIVILLPYVMLTSGFSLHAVDLTGAVNLLIVGAVHTGVTYCMYFTALRDLPGQKAAILSYIDPLVAVLVSALILGESMTVMHVVGGGLILGFTLWNELGTPAKAD